MTTEAQIEHEHAEHVAGETIVEIIRDRRPHTASDWPPAGQVYEAVSGEFRALVYQVAEMAEHEPDNLVTAAEYLHGLLEREPLRSAPFWEPQRVVLGLFLLGLTNALTVTEVITAEERAALRPGYYRDAVAAVNAAFDPVYIPPAEPEEGDQPSTDEAAPMDEDDDDARFL